MIRNFLLTLAVLAYCTRGDAYDTDIDDFFEDSQGWLLFRKEIISTKNKFGVGSPFTIKLSVENIGQSDVSNVAIRDHFDSNLFQRYDTTTSSESVEFTIESIAAGSRKIHEFYYKLSPRQEGVVPLERANISYQTEWSGSLSEEISHGSLSLKSGVSSLYLSDNDAPFSSLSVQFYHAKLTQNYFDAPSQLSNMFYLQQHGALAATKRYLSDRIKSLTSSSSSTSGNDGVLPRLLSSLRALAQVQSLPLPYVIYRDSQVHNVKMSTGSTSDSSDAEGVEGAEGAEAAEGAERSEMDSYDAGERATSSDAEAGKRGNDADDSVLKKEQSTELDGNGKILKNLVDLEEIDALSGFDTSAQVSKYVLSGQGLVSFDLGVLHVLSGSQYSRAVADHFVSWLVVLLGMLASVLVPLVCFYKNGGNFEEIPLVGVTLLLPMVRKIDDDLLPSLLPSLMGAVNTKNSSASGATEANGNGSVSVSSEKSEKSGSGSPNKSDTTGTSQTKGK